MFTFPSTPPNLMPPVSSFALQQTTLLGLPSCDPHPSSPVNYTDLHQLTFLHPHLLLYTIPQVQLVFPKNPYKLFHAGRMSMLFQDQFLSSAAEHLLLPPFPRTTPSPTHCFVLVLASSGTMWEPTSHSDQENRQANFRASPLPPFLQG